MKKMHYLQVFLFLLCFINLPTSYAQVGELLNIDDKELAAEEVKTDLPCPSDEKKAPNKTIRSIDVKAPDADSALTRYQNEIILKETSYECETEDCPGKSSCELEFVSWNKGKKPTPKACGPGCWTFPEVKKNTSKVKCTKCTLKAPTSGYLVGLPDLDLPHIESLESQSTADAAYQSLFVYPNPANEVLNVEIDGEQELAQGNLVIYNLLGKPIQHQSLGNLSKGFSTQSLDVSQLPSGFYFLVLYSGKAQVQALEFKITR